MYLCYILLHDNPKYVCSSEGGVKESPDSLAGRPYGCERNRCGVGAGGVSGVSEAFNAELVPQGVLWSSSTFQPSCGPPTAQVSV